MGIPDDYETQTAAIIAALGTLKGYGPASVVATDQTNKIVTIYPSSFAGMLPAIAPNSQLGAELGLAPAARKFWNATPSGSSGVVIVDDPNVLWAFCRFTK